MILYLENVHPPELTAVGSCHRPQSKRNCARKEEEKEEKFARY